MEIRKENDQFYQLKGFKNSWIVFEIHLGL